MSDGHYCFVRDLGPVKGGKGMKHHEVLVDFNRRGIVALLKRLLARPQKSGSQRRLTVREAAGWDETLAASVSAIARPSPPYRDIG
jgi:hypothetical protein